jgi:hypothetical protein
MLTEDQAKKTWCPFVRMVAGTIDLTDGKSAHSGVQPAYNRVVDEAKWAFPQGAACVASACGAWRWKTGPEVLAAWNQRRLADQPRPVVTGYCGLAGKPE